ncbi:hypothetical protein [Solidesulfovibrio carbinoliphilus]|nr:hypothetical protein [Solidesulfovibrio carbinoliphilus]
MMPTEYVRKLAEEHDMSIEEAEKKWDEAKEKAKEEGTSKDYYAYVTSIFKSMMHEPKGKAAKGHESKSHETKGHETKGHAAKDSGHKKAK